jgi:predicted permease
MRALWHDARIACRSLAKQPAFSLMSIGILAVGIAGTMMVFGLFDGLFLRPFPVPEQDRLMDLNERAPQWGQDYTMITYADFCGWREHNRSFESMYAWATWGANLSIDGRAERVETFVTTHEFFKTLDIRPVLGRCFTAEEDGPHGPKVVLLSTGLWDRVFGKDPAVLGRSLQLDGDYFTVIGVLPPAAAFPLDVDLWRPLALDPQQGRGMRNLFAMGRLKEGVTVEQASEDLTRVHQAMIAENLADAATSPTIMQVRERLLGLYRQGLAVLLGAVGFVLLIACCNVTSLMLARGTQRGREIALCLALGATRKRIVAQVLMESVVLSLAGAVVGVPLGQWGLDLLIRYFVRPAHAPRWMTFQPDFHWAFFGLVAIGATTVLSGMIPALHAIGRRDLHGVLQASGVRSTSGQGRRRTLGGVVVGQVALALTLLIGAGLVFRSFQKVRGTDPGFRADGVLTYQVSLSYAGYAEAGKRRAFFEQHLERVRALPGVISAGLVSGPPMSGFYDAKAVEVEGGLKKGPGEEEPRMLFLLAMPGYFETMGIRLLSGRFFGPQDDRPGSEPTVIVNESFARLFWPGADAVNKRLQIAGWPGSRRVIAVVGDVKHYDLEKPMPAGFYVPYGQAPSHAMYGVVHTQGDPFVLVPAIREIVRAADPDLPMHDIKMMSQRVRDSMLLRVMCSWMFGAFGIIAATMAFAGIYGVVSYWVGQRTQEIGIRMALGARAPEVIGMVIGQGLRLVALGLGLGLAGALGLSRLLGDILYDVSPTDPLTFAGVGLLLIAAGTLACYVPARRAARIDPMAALRHE